MRLKVATLPAGVSWAHLVGAGCLAGLGFTMPLFIATLAFHDAAFLEAAKLGILVASVVAGTEGFLVLARSLCEQTGIR